MMFRYRNIIIPNNFPRIRRFISALYLSGDKAKEQYAVLNPYMNFSEIFDKSEEMEKNIQLRKLNLDFNKICENYKNYCKIQNEKVNLENKKKKIVEELYGLTKTKRLEYSQLQLQEKLNKVPQTTETKLPKLELQKLDDLKEEGKSVREKLKALKDANYTFEEEFIEDFLQLPNNLNSKCPTGENVQLMYRQGLPDNNKKSKSHLSRTDLIDFKDNSCYYLLNDAAHFDIEFVHNCTEYFTHNNYTQMSNPDFARKILLEAAGVVNEKAFHEIDEVNNTNSKINSLHLNGGGSFTSFLGFISKLTVFTSILPMKLISSGRQYYAVNDKAENSQGLFTATQSNVVQAFVATETENQANNEFDDLLNLIVNIYKKLGIHFQIVYQTANNLSRAESLKASIQMYSPYYNAYIEVGNLSNYSNFISKRLLFNFKDGKNYKFPHIIGGTIVDASKILGCLIENNKNLKSPIYVEQKSSAVENFKDLFQ